MRLGCLVLLSLVCAACGGRGVERDLLGAWQCVDPGCQHDELEFVDEDGEHLLRSRPYAGPTGGEGRWSLEGEALTVVCCGGLRWDYQVVYIDQEYLRLREDETEFLFQRVGSQDKVAAPQRRDQPTSDR